MEYLVSTIIPTYKRADMLDRAILSVLNQTYKCVEVVVVDDNDPNSEWRIKTKNIMSKYQGDKRIKYICHEKNMNGSVARNTGIKNASGEIVCFLDDDDEFEKNKIQNQLNYLLVNREFHGVYCGWDRDNKIVIPEKTGDLSYELLSGTNLIYSNTIMMYKQDAINCGGWDESFMRHQEAAFMLRYFRCGGKIGVVSENLVKFDVSDRSNEAKNSVIYEQHMDHYLNSFLKEIDECEKKQKGAKKFIYANRYRGVFFAHLKNKNIKEAVKLYIKMTKMYPLAFHNNIVKYVFVKISGGI